VDQVKVEREKELPGGGKVGVSMWEEKKCGITFSDHKVVKLKTDHCCQDKQQPLRLKVHLHR
jgi:hypothetical protein